MPSQRHTFGEGTTQTGSPVLPGPVDSEEEPLELEVSSVLPLDVWHGPEPDEESTAPLPEAAGMPVELPTAATVVVAPPEPSSSGKNSNGPIPQPSEKTIAVTG